MCVYIYIEGILGFTSLRLSQVQIPRMPRPPCRVRRRAKAAFSKERKKHIPTGSAIFGAVLKGSFKGDVNLDVDVEVDVDIDIDSYLGCSKGGY